MRLHKYSKVHLNVRYIPNFIHTEKSIWKNIWLSASPEGYISVPLTSTGMILLQTWMCFSFENLQENTLETAARTQRKGPMSLRRPSDFTVWSDIMKLKIQMHFNAFYKSMQHTFYLLQSNFGYFYYGNLYNTLEWIKCCSSRVSTGALIV